MYVILNWTIKKQEIIIMDLFNKIINLFEKDETGVKDLLRQRNKTKENLKKQLKNVLYMTDAEISAVISVVEKYEKKRDDEQKKFDINDCTTASASKMDENLASIQQEMETEIKTLITNIMQRKLELAKQLKNKKII